MRVLMMSQLVAMAAALLLTLLGQMRPPAAEIAEGPGSPSAAPVWAR